MRQPRSQVKTNPLFTTDTTGKRICGSFRKGQRARYDLLVKTEGLTPEKLKANPPLFREIICHQNPYDGADGHKNGRCRRHGAKQGRKVIHGKYSNTLPSMTEEEMNLWGTSARHQSLNEELSILSKFIKDELPKAMGAAASEANERLRKKIKKLEKAFAEFNMPGMKEAMAEIVGHCDEQRSANDAKKDVAYLIKQYSEVFKVEIQNRALSGEYIPKKELVNGYRYFLTLCAEKLLNYPGLYEEIKQEFARRIARGNVFGIQSSAPAIETGNFSGFENQDEAAQNNYIDAEYSTDVIPE